MLWAGPRVFDRVAEEDAELLLLAATQGAMQGATQGDGSL